MSKYFNFVDDEEEDEFLVIEEDDEEESFQFTEEIPTRKTALADPEVQAKAKQARRNRSTKNKTYEGKRADGWSYCCAHMRHLPNLCEREQVTNGITCTCPCHEERGWDRESAIRRHEDEEFLILFD